MQIKQISPFQFSPFMLRIFIVQYSVSVIIAIHMMIVKRTTKIWTPILKNLKKKNLFSGHLKKVLLFEKENTQKQTVCVVATPWFLLLTRHGSLLNLN